jgi:DNA anti-recombination protein RmuC
MAACHLRNKTLEVTNSNVQDSATVIGEDTPSISIVTTNDNDSHESAQIQGMLADVLNTLNSIQSQNVKAKEELGAKLMAENQKLAARLTEQLQHEISKVHKITKVTEAFCQLREETRHNLQSIRDDLNKLPASVDESIKAH